jgi:pimeloyl-ACP methyl ester carboxylesterase
MNKLADRQQNNALRLFPGWAFDEEIFRPLDLPPLNQPLVLGWSQGAYAAVEFAAKHPELAGRLFLVSARPKYPAADIAIARNGLKQNARGFLINFYRDCFAAEEKEPFLWFKENLMKKYLETFSAEELLRQLDALSRQSLDIRKLPPAVKITFVHGQNDKTAPAEEIKEFAGHCPQAKLIILKNCGHLPFLHEEFASRLKQIDAPITV